MGVLKNSYEKLIKDYKKYGREDLPPPLSWLDFLWRKKYLWIFVFLAILGTLILFFYFKTDLNNHLILYTLLAIFWYSRETMDLKRNSTKEIEQLRRQYTTSIRPYLRLQKKAGENRLQLVNEGKGVAVSLSPVYKRNSQVTHLLKIPAMAAAPNSVTESFIPRNLDLELDPSAADFLIEVTYTNIEGRKYVAVFKSNTNFNDGFEIIKQEEITNES